MYVLGNGTSSSPSCGSLVKLLLDTADALLECLIASAHHASPAPPAVLGSPGRGPRKSGPESGSGPGVAGKLLATTRPSAMQPTELGSGRGSARRTLVLALRVLGRALAAPGGAPQDAVRDARAFVKERYGVLGELAGWPAQSATLQVRYHLLFLLWLHK